jgi:HAD superfamily hydrolase (TIGR01549 family)
VAGGEITSITTILCDLDGTLVDSRRDIATAFQHAWQSVVAGPPPRAAAIAQHIGKPLAEMLSELGAVLSLPRLCIFQTSYRQMFARQDARHTLAYPGVVTSLRALSGFTLGIVTTKDQRQAEMVLQRLALTPFFRHVQGGTTGLALKPAPDTILAALAALHSTPARAIMVGDTPADILAGKAAGTKTCAVTYGFGTRDVLLQYAPDYVIDTFGELLSLVRPS